MYRLVRFIKRNSVLFLFILLEVVAISRYAESSSYSRARILSASSSVGIGVRRTLSSVGDYFRLSRDNERLLDRVAQLEDSLFLYRGSVADSVVLRVPSKFLFSTARVISNSISRLDNYFVIDRGAADGIEPDMAILTVDGYVAGFVERSSEHYSVCMSVLNRDFRVGGRLKGKDFFGSVSWTGRDSRYVTLSDIPQYAPVQKGDTVLSAYSSRFPQDTPIGIVEDFAAAGDGTYFDVRVRLDAVMASISDVMVVKYTDSQELDSLAGTYFADTSIHEPAEPVANDSEQ